LEKYRHIGLLGGTFDPIHYGHLVIAEEVWSVLHLDEMVFIPAGHPPHKLGRSITLAEHRVAMLELAIASNPHFAISLIDVERSGPSYTVDTVRQLHEEWGTNVQLYFVIGWDSLEELHLWYDPVGILEQLTYLVAVRRPGYIEEPEYKDQLEARVPGIKQRLLVIPVPQLAISATELRQRVAEGRPIKYQTPEAVEQYIAEHGLYQH
jgi:nicotinate-nucleotide adenylyltransferase